MSNCLWPRSTIYHSKHFQKKFQISIKNKRNMKRFDLKEYSNNYKALTLSLVYSDNLNELLGTQNKSVLDCIDRHAPLVKNTLTDSLLLGWSNYIAELRQKHVNYPFLVHHAPTEENWTIFREGWTKAAFYKNMLSSKQ